MIKSSVPVPGGRTATLSKFRETRVSAGVPRLLVARWDDIRSMADARVRKRETSGALLAFSSQASARKPLLLARVCYTRPSTHGRPPSPLFFPGVSRFAICPRSLLFFLPAHELVLPYLWTMPTSYPFFGVARLPYRCRCFRSNFALAPPEKNVGSRSSTS